MTANHDTDTDTLIYWAVVRNQTDRHSYLELEHRGGKKWGAVLGDDEFTFQSDSTDFFAVLTAALAKLEARHSQSS